MTAEGSPKRLHDRLKETIGSIESAARDYERGGEISVLYEVEDQALQDIQQAFKDVGYKCYPDITQYQLAQGGYMTGREWYDQFEDNFLATKKETVSDQDREAVLDAAMKASGIEE